MGWRMDLGPSSTNAAHVQPYCSDLIIQGGFLDFGYLGQLGRAHWATFGPTKAHQPLTADVMLT
jgi:hypothetical protein